MNSEQIVGTITLSLIFIHGLNVIIATSWGIYIVYKFSYREHYIESRKQQIYQQFRVSVIWTISVISCYLLAVIVIGTTYTYSVKSLLDQHVLQLVKVVAISICVISFTLYRFAYESIRKMLAMGIEASRKNRNKKPDTDGATSARISKSGQVLSKKGSLSGPSPVKHKSPAAETPVILEQDETDDEFGIEMSPTILLPRK